MASVYRRRNSKIWTIAWIDPSGRRRMYSSGTTIKRKALQMVAKIVEGDPSPTSASIQTLAQQWLSELESLGRSPKHVSQRRRAIEALGFDVAKANAALGTKASSGEWSDRTVVTYHGALMQFGKWCVDNGHRDRNPMLGLKKPSRQTGRVYVRGVLTKEQATILCSSPSIEEQRRLVYKTALSTGLRIGELRKLRPDDLKMIKGQHCIHLKPKQVKNRFESVIPIPEELYEQLLGGLDMRGFDKAARTLRKDLLAAGLPLEDADGHPIDFHSLRATFGDLLIQQGVAIPTVARLMRHSDGGALLLKRYAGGVSVEIQKVVLI